MVPWRKGYESAWASILDPNQFWTTWPVASASKECPAYSQTNWPDDGRAAGCMWNGPTWPHANSLVMTAMGAHPPGDQGQPHRQLAAPEGAPLGALSVLHQGPVPQPGHRSALDRRVLQRRYGRVENCRAGLQPFHMAGHPDPRTDRRHPSRRRHPRARSTAAGECHSLLRAGWTPISRPRRDGRLGRAEARFTRSLRRRSQGPRRIYRRPPGRLGPAAIAVVSQSQSVGWVQPTIRPGLAVSCTTLHQPIQFDLAKVRPGSSPGAGQLELEMRLISPGRVAHNVAPVLGQRQDAIPRVADP